MMSRITIRWCCSENIMNANSSSCCEFNILCTIMYTLCRRMYNLLFLYWNTLYTLKPSHTSFAGILLAPNGKAESSCEINHDSLTLRKERWSINTHARFNRVNMPWCVYYFWSFWWIAKRYPELFNVDSTRRYVFLYVVWNHKRNRSLISLAWIRISKSQLIPRSWISKRLLVEFILDQIFAKQMQSYVLSDPCKLRSANFLLTVLKSLDVNGIVRK